MKPAHESPPLPYSVIVTAAGKGTRMGGPKALLAVRWGDLTAELPLALAHARAHLNAGAERVVVVVRPETARVLARFAQRGLDLVLSTAPDELGPAGSIRCGLSYLDLPPEAWVFVEPVDAPPTSVAIRNPLLARAARAPEPAAVRPVHRGQRGHPVLVQRRYLEPLMSDAPPPLRDVLRELGDQVADVEVDDVRAVTGFDVADDIQRWYGHPAHFFDEDEPTVA